MRRQTIQISVFPAIIAIGWLFSLATAVASAEPCACAPSPCVEDDEGASWIFEPAYFSDAIYTDSDRLSPLRPDLPGERLPLYPADNARIVRQCGCFSPHPELGQWGSDSPLRRMGIPLPGGRNALWTVGKSARALDIAVRFVAKSLWTGTIA